LTTILQLTSQTMIMCISFIQKLLFACETLLFPILFYVMYPFCYMLSYVIRLQYGRARGVVLKPPFWTANLYRLEWPNVLFAPFLISIVSPINVHRKLPSKMAASILFFIELRPKYGTYVYVKRHKFNWIQFSPWRSISVVGNCNLIIMINYN
jgi:hypothetical protein